MIKIVITGAECSGKTTLSNDLAEHYKATLVPEYARQYLEKIDRPYTKSDLITIAMGQKKSEKKCKSDDLVICDTSLLVIKVWSKVKYQSIHPWITVLLEESKPDLYILPNCDIPYEEDPLREHPDGRHELQQLYIAELNRMKIPWIRVSGSREERIRQACISIDPLITSKS